LAGWRAIRPDGEGLKPASADVVGAESVRLWPVVFTALALTWLNPAVYLDTTFLIGSVANTYGDERWLFGAGAATGSALWFVALGVGARYLGRWLRTPRSWRLLDGGIGLLLLFTASRLISG